VGIQFTNGAILIVGGQVAMDPACCCAASGCGCCDCPSGAIQYDATFTGEMAELNGTFTSTDRESYGEEGCRYTFGPESPIASITFTCAGSATVIDIRAGTVEGDLHTYVNYSDASYAMPGGCPFAFGQLFHPEWADGSLPPLFIWQLLSLLIHCQEET
jgi:hypothetical protein